MAVSDDEGCAIFMGLGITILLTACLCLFRGCEYGKNEGRTRATSEIRKEAVDAGVGRWVVDQNTGESRFEFIPAAEKVAE